MHNHLPSMLDKSQKSTETKLGLTKRPPAQVKNEHQALALGFTTGLLVQAICDGRCCWFVDDA